MNADAGHEDETVPARERRKPRPRQLDQLIAGLEPLAAALAVGFELARLAVHDHGRTSR
jgi:hypothetical protein